MKIRTKTYLLLSTILFFSIMLYVGIYIQIDHRRMMTSFETASAQEKHAFTAEQDSTEMRMLQIASFVANNPKVQQLFLLGKNAIELEGGGAGGELSAQVRASLYELVQRSQKVLAEQFGFRQLQFLFGPGAISFLRVHRPEKFGDQMGQVRATIVTANAKQENTMGFETGRSAPGLRGVVPVYAVDSVTRKKVHVGALEAGTSFSTMLSLFHKNSPWLNMSVLLNQEYLQANLSPSIFEKIAKERPFIKDCYIEGTSSSKIEDFLSRNDFSKFLTDPGHRLLRDGKTHYSVTSFPLRDFQGETDPNQPDAGRVILWKDVSDDIAGYYNDVRNLITYGALLFLLIELLVFYGLKFMTRGLQIELESTRELEVASENARLIAEESSRLKTDFLSNISHELRTPMNAIMGLGQLLGDSSLDNRQQGLIDKINLSSKHLLSQINEILLIAKIDGQAKETLPHENFNLPQLINLIINKFSAKAKDQGVNLIVDFPENLPQQVAGYPAQLEQILNQLLGNAIKFGHGGDVTLSLTLLDRHDDTATLEFAVIDQGIGISAEQQTLIFQPFQQVDGSKTRRYGGTGLGLTIARKVCRQLGEKMTVESTLGQGSRFTFQLKFKTLTEDSNSTTVAILDSGSGPVKTENISLGRGTFAEIEQLLQQLEDPLEKMQPRPCQAIANKLKDRRWPANCCADIGELVNLIGQYRFVEAQQIVDRLKKSILRTDIFS